MCPTRAGRACRREKGRSAKRHECLKFGQPWEVVGSKGFVQPRTYLETLGEYVRGDSAGRTGKVYGQTARNGRRQMTPTPTNAMDAFEAPTWVEYRHGLTWDPASRDRASVAESRIGVSFFHADRAVDGDRNLTVESFLKMPRERVPGVTAGSSISTGQCSWQKHWRGSECFVPIGNRRLCLSAEAGLLSIFSPQAARSPGSIRGSDMRSTLTELPSSMTSGQASGRRVIIRFRLKRFDLEAQASSMVQSHRVAFKAQARRLSKAFHSISGKPTSDGSTISPPLSIYPDASPGTPPDAHRPFAFIHSMKRFRLWPSVRARGQAYGIDHESWLKMSSIVRTRRCRGPQTRSPRYAAFVR